MKKKREILFPFGDEMRLRIRKMKLTLLLVFLVMATFGNSFSQVTLSLHFDKANIFDVLGSIEKKTDFVFLYKDEILDGSKEISVDFQDAKFEEVLKSICEQSNVDFEVREHQIILKEKANVPIPLVQQQPQKKEISGSVKDSKGLSLPGVSVVVKGTTIGIVTDADGKFRISGPAEAKTLVFSFVGMKSQEIIFGNRTSINVVMEEEIAEIEEVVAVGYGTQKKVNLTGAVESVGSKVLESRPIVNLGQGLQGVIPNLNISFTNGAPGKAADFNIRGNTSINGGSPLVLVDGVQMDINLINPSDIESISVLKDGSSAAIYGARAGYGVILIKTKGGNKNKPPQISYDGNVSFNSLTIIPDLMESLDFVNFKNTASINAGAGQYFSDVYIAHVKNYLANPTPQNAVFTPDYYTNDPGRYSYSGNTDWYRATNKENAISNQHAVGISGGTENTTYYASVSYLDQGGFMRYFDDSYKRFNAKANIESDITKWLTVFAKTTFNNNNRSKPRYRFGSIDDNMGLAGSEPLMPVYHPDGNFAGQGWWTNPVALQTEGGKITDRVNDSWMTGGLKIKPLKGLVVNLDYTYNYYAEGVDTYVREYLEHYADPNRVTLFPHTTPSFVQQEQYTNKYQVLNLFAQYDKTIGKNTISAIVGFNQEDKSMVYFSAKRTNLINNDLPSIRQATGDQTVDGLDKEWAIRGAFYRLNYAFNEKYLLELDSRYDGSSRFPKDSRFAFFPSVSAAWRISKESFFKPITNIVSELKVRASYSSLGNQNLGANYYPYIASLGAIPQIGYIINGVRPLAITPAGLVSPGLTWETVKQFDIGLDFGLLQNKFTGSFDIYQRSTLNMLTAGQPLSAVLGTGVPLENAADMKTNGFELNLRWRDQIGDLKYYVGASLSDYQSEITRFANPQKTLGSHYVDEKLGEIWGYKSNGLFQTQAEVDKAPSQSQIWGGAWAPGDVKYEDLNGDGKVNSGKSTLDDHGDLTIIGNSTPRFQYALSGGLEWEGFDFSFLLQGIAKRDAWIGGQEFWGFVAEWYAVPKTLSDSWSPTNRNAYFPRPYINYGHNNQISSRYLQDASYLRLKNMTLGYRIPKSLTKKIQINDLRIYISAENLLTFTKLNRNFDPESVYNAFAYPIQRAISFGINLKL